MCIRDRVARASGVFEKVFSGEEDISETMAYLRGESGTVIEETTYPSSLIDRIKWKSPYPIIRHHFGLPSLDDTISGIETLADSGVLDVISIGPDQNAQENFFHPEEMDPDQQGSGGVPVRSARDFERLYQASRRGNYPLMRCYSGTRDVIPFARVLLNTINNAWAAIPLSWYNVLDKRGPREIEDSMKEAQQAIKWHADQGIPVEAVSYTHLDVYKRQMTGHSCEMEMSIMMYLWPQGVKTDALTPGKIRQEALDAQGRKLGIHEAHFFDEITENGALGDATKADPEWGKKAVEVGLTRLLPYIREFMKS